jgi:hypothetical protein
MRHSTPATSARDARFQFARRPKNSPVQPARRSSTPGRGAVGNSPSPALTAGKLTACVRPARCTLAGGGTCALSLARGWFCWFFEQGRQELMQRAQPTGRYVPACAMRRSMQQDVMGVRDRFTPRAGNEAGRLALARRVRLATTHASPILALRLAAPYWGNTFRFGAACPRFTRPSNTARARPCCATACFDPRADSTSAPRENCQLGIVPAALSPAPGACRL